MNMLSDKNIKNKWKHFDCEIGKEKKNLRLTLHYSATK